MRLLKPDGLLACFTGTYFLPYFIEHFQAAGLRYEWTVAEVHRFRAIRNAGQVKSQWSPIVIFRKEPDGRLRLNQVLEDVLRFEDVDKTLHPWQQSLATSAALVRSLSRPGDLVVRFVRRQRHGPRRSGPGLGLRGGRGSPVRRLRDRPEAGQGGPCPCRRGPRQAAGRADRNWRRSERAQSPRHQDRRRQRRWPPHPARRHRGPRRRRRPATSRSWTCRRCPRTSTPPFGRTSPSMASLSRSSSMAKAPSAGSSTATSQAHRRRTGLRLPGDRQSGLTEQEMRTLARALNMARRQLDQAGRRALIADQLRETPERSNHWVAKQLGVDDKTVASVRADLQTTSEIPKLDRTLGADGKYRPASSSVGNAGGVQADGHDHESAAPARRSIAPRTSSPDSEEAILRAAAEVRQRRVADQLRKAQGGATARPRPRRGGGPAHPSCTGTAST